MQCKMPKITEPITFKKRRQTASEKSVKLFHSCSFSNGVTAGCPKHVSVTISKGPSSETAGA